MTVAGECAISIEVVGLDSRFRFAAVNEGCPVLEPIALNLAYRQTRLGQHHRLAACAKKDYGRASERWFYHQGR